MMIVQFVTKQMLHHLTNYDSNLCKDGICGKLLGTLWTDDSMIVVLQLIEIDDQVSCICKRERFLHLATPAAPSSLTCQGEGGECFQYNLSRKYTFALVTVTTIRGRCRLSLACFGSRFAYSGLYSLLFKPGLLPSADGERRLLSHPCFVM